MAARLILDQLVEVRVLGPQWLPPGRSRLRPPSGRPLASAGASMGALGLEPRTLG